MTEESENKQRASTPANVTAGWNKLPNEMQNKIIAHAVDDVDA